MKILITGATGLIGKKLGKKLFDQGHQIFVVSRNKEKALKSLNYTCEVIEGDLNAGPLQSSNLESLEAVIHLMGEGIANKRWSKVQKKKIYDSRIVGTRNLVQSFSKKNNLKVFVSASAVGIYGDRQEEELNEKSNPGTGFLPELCQAWEKEVDQIQEKGNIRIVKARLAAVLASEGGALKKMLPAFKLCLGGRLGSGQQWMSWIHIDDVIELFTQSIENEKFQNVFNFVSPGCVRNQEFTQILASVLKRPVGPPIPKFALKLALGEMSRVLLDSQKVKPDRLLGIQYHFEYPLLKQALAQLL